MSTCPCVWDDTFVAAVGRAAHTFGAAFFVMMCAMLFGKRSTLYAFVVLVVFAAIKEFAWDANHETTCDRGSDLEDFLFYGLGGLVGLVVIAFSKLPNHEGPPPRGYVQADRFGP